MKLIPGMTQTAKGPGGSSPQQDSEELSIDRHVPNDDVLDRPCWHDGEQPPESTLEKLTRLFQKLRNAK